LSATIQTIQAGQRRGEISTASKSGKLVL